MATVRAPPLDDRPLAPGLYVVSTPIGNLRDITLRALDVLAQADIVLAEDTRVAARLLGAFGLKAKVWRYDDHAGEAARPGILTALAQGSRVALTTDAGAPMVSDPGYRLVLEAIAQGTAVIPIPGASALLAGLTAAGLPTDRFLFAGFPPHKSAGRRSFFAELAPIRATLVIFEGASRPGARADQAARDHHPGAAGCPRRRSPAAGPQGRGGRHRRSGRNRPGDGGGRRRRAEGSALPRRTGRRGVGGGQGAGPAATGPLPPRRGAEGRAWRIDPRSFWRRAGRAERPLGWQAGGRRCWPPSG